MYYFSIFDPAIAYTLDDARDIADAYIGARERKDFLNAHDFLDTLIQVCNLLNIKLDKVIESVRVWREAVA